VPPHRQFLHLNCLDIPVTALAGFTVFDVGRLGQPAFDKLGDTVEDLCGRCFERGDRLFVVLIDESINPGARRYRGGH
jgi:hypothetical protein